MIYYESLIYTVLNGHYLKFDIFYLTILKKYFLELSCINYISILLYYIWGIYLMITNAETSIVEKLI